MLSRHLTRGIAWVLLGVGLARPSAAVDTILVHGHVFTGKGNWAEAIAVHGGRIEAVGSNQAIEALRTSTTRLIDIQGRTVLPGIIDSHLHMLFGALELHGLNLSTPDGSLTPDYAEQFRRRQPKWLDQCPPPPLSPPCPASPPPSPWPPW
jgi:hypothetical protein